LCQFTDLLPSAKQKFLQAKLGGASDTDALDWATGWFAHKLSRTFEVSTVVVETRLRKEKLVERMLR
jgi:hypothetical protein